MPRKAGKPHKETESYNVFVLGSGRQEVRKGETTVKKQKQETELQIIEVHRQHMDVYVVGESPLVLNRMSEKAKHELLHPKGRMTAYDKQVNVKHNPREEFNSAPYRLSSGPTLLALPSTAFKGALSSAALDIQGAKKAQIARLTYVEGEYVGVYGIPKLYMSVVRSADMNHTPDIRTRAILKEWAAKFTVSYVIPLLKQTAIINLIGASGVYIGVGDGRPEKGKLSFGRFTIVRKDDADFNRIMKYGGRRLQEIAMKTAEPYDAESKEMFEWWHDEIKRRNFEKAPDRKVAKPNGHIPKGGKSHSEEAFA
jgi:hypothetical protein